MFESRLAIAIIFDISPQNYLGGVLYINLVKRQLIELAIKLGLSGGLYVSHPDNKKVPRRQGESVQTIDEYVQEPNFNLEKAFKRALLVLSQEDQDDKKFIILISDRVNENYRKVLAKVQKLGKNYEFVFLSVNQENGFETIEIDKLKENLCKNHLKLI